jgi:hypothetical protein
MTYRRPPRQGITALRLITARVPRIRNIADLSRSIPFLPRNDKDTATSLLDRLRHGIIEP